MEPSWFGGCVVVEYRNPKSSILDTLHGFVTTQKLSLSQASSNLNNIISNAVVQNCL